MSPSKAQQKNRRHMHHRLMKQTHHKLKIVCNKHCMHMASTGEADRHHLLDAVPELNRHN